VIASQAVLLIDRQTLSGLVRTPSFSCFSPGWSLFLEGDFDLLLACSGEMPGQHVF
jgi:hypothetical protein